MSKNGGFLRTLIGVAAAAGVIYGATRVVDECSKQDDAEAFAKLLKRQEVYDVLTEADLRKWFLESAKEHPVGVRFLVAKATKENAKMFAITSLPKGLDTEHTFFQAVVTDDGNVLEVRIVSCASLSDELSKRFESQDTVLM